MSWQLSSARSYSSPGSSHRKTFTLNTGDKIPAIGLGTWQSRPKEVQEAVEIALRRGYKHIDTAVRDAGDVLNGGDRANWCIACLP